MSVGVSSTGSYLPYHRIERETIADAWDKPSLPGFRTVTNHDEDSLTMAVEAAFDCKRDLTDPGIEGVFFATTTPPYLEKQGSALIAATLDLNEDIVTRDFTGSIRSGTIALNAATEAIESGEARRILVVASDSRRAEPQSDLEQVMGDAAAAVLVDAEPSLLEIEGRLSKSKEFLGTWRRSEDLYVQVFESRLERTYGYLDPLTDTLTSLLEDSGRTTEELDHVLLTWPDARSHRKAASRLEVDEERLHRSLFEEVGHTGSAHPLLMLADVSSTLTTEDRLLLGSYGDGSDGFLMRSLTSTDDGHETLGLDPWLESTATMDSYTQMLDFQELLKVDEPTRPSSAIQYWRDQPAEQPLHGVRCNNCGTVQYPIHRVCFECGAGDDFEEVTLSKNGTVYTYTLDHIERSGGKGQYLATALPRLVIDLEEGGRIFLTMTDGDPQAVEIGMDVELTFRKIHEGSSFNNYYWKARIPRMDT